MSEEMTNHEAVEFLKNMIGEECGRAIGKDGFYAELLGYHVQALKKAIAALSAEPCEDAISRQEAIRIAEQGQVQGYEWQFKQLCDLPSVKSTKTCYKMCERWKDKPKTGHWISDAIQGEIEGQIVKAFHCSKCGAISVFRMTGGEIVNGDLCPNCGAKMSQEGTI